MGEANLNMDDAEDDGTFVPTDGKQPQALLLSLLDSMCAQFVLHTVCTAGLCFNLRTSTNDILTVCAPELIWPVTIIQRLQRFLSTRCADMPGWHAVGRLNLPTSMDRHGQWSSAFDESSLFYYLDEYAEYHAKDMLTAFGTSCDALGERLTSEHILPVSNIDMLARVLDLPPHEHALLLSASLVKCKCDLRAAMVDCKATYNQEAFQSLASLAGVSMVEVATSLWPGSRLETLGLIEPPLPENSITDLGDLIHISDCFLHVLLGDYAYEVDMMAVFTHPTPSITLSQSDYPHVEADARYLTALLENVSQQRAAGVNILLYGAPGTGKTELARVSARDAGCELCEVDCLDKGGNSLTGKDRYRSPQVSQAFLCGRPDTVLPFDEVEDVFPGPTRKPMGLFGHEGPRDSVNNKAWVNQMPEQNPVPAIWVSGSIRQIDPAYLHRLQFYLELKASPPTARESVIRKHLEGPEVSDVFTAKLTTRKTLTPAQIDSAVRLARLTQPAMEEPAESLIEHQLDRADQVVSLRSEVQAHRVVTGYKLDYLNLETRFSVERIIETLRTRRRGTLCSYGPPGAGKTVLAEHITVQFDVPLLIRHTSGSMSKYVGETEQQITAMFSRAEEERTLPLLGEADNFMQSRQGAVCNYEVSEVNEMLQGMERFDGIFIYTTNLFDRIDEAALRWLAPKIRFKSLVRAQREQTFIAEALGGKAEVLKPVWRETLASLDMLTPGDLAVVKQQSVLLGETPELEAFLAQLRQEHSIKPELRERRSIGSTPR